MIPALSQVCTLNSSFEDDIADYAAGHCRAVEIWLTKLEEYLSHASLSDARHLLRDHQITPIAASFQGGLLSSQGEARTASWELFRQRLELCQELEIQTLIVACDVLGPLNQKLVDRTKLSLKQAAEAAEQHQIRLALEFQAHSAFGNNLQTAVALVEEVGSPKLGICLDLFHFNVGPSKYSDLILLTAENLFHVQLSDLADIPREFANDSDRILPGDGDFSIAPLVEYLREIKYESSVSIELMNPQIWQVPPRQFGEIAITALRQTLGYASMD